MKISLEKWQEQDFQTFFEISQDQQLYASMSDDFPKTPEACRQVVGFFSASTDTSECVRAVKADNQIIGCIAAFFETGMYHKNAEISYWLNTKYRGQGIMPQVIQIFAQYLLSEYGLHRIWARPFLHNKASQRALEKAGFRYEGTLRECAFKGNTYLDSAVYALIQQ